MKLAELETHPWSFATTRASLAADSTEPEFGRANAFQLPSDYVKLLSEYAEDNSNTNDWEIEGRKIYTDYSAPLEIRYIYDVTDPNEMTPLFREVLATRLALELCEELTQSNTKKAELSDEYELVVRRAKRSNAFAKVAAQPPTDSWITVRD